MRLQAPAKAAIAVLVVAVIGFADAAYLTIEHYQNAIPPCTITQGCETVLTSAYSTVAGVPVSLLGAVYYFLVLAGCFAFLVNKSEPAFRWGLFLTVPAFLATLYFLYLQAFVIHAFCQYCLGSAVTSTLLFVFALVIFAKYRASGTVTG